MTIETKNPIPAGRYWIEVSTDPVPMGTWLGFLDAAKGFVHVESTESDDSFAFSIFNTTKTLVWPDGIGSPNVAPASIKSRSDTVQRADPEPDATDQIPTVKSALAGIGDTVQLAVVVLVAIVGIRILASAGRKGKK